MYVVAASSPFLINYVKPEFDLNKIYPLKIRTYFFVAHIQNSLIG